MYTQTVGTVEQEYRHERMHCSRLLSGDNEVLAQALVLHHASCIFGPNIGPDIGPNINPDIEPNIEPNIEPDIEPNI